MKNWIVTLFTGFALFNPNVLAMAASPSDFLELADLRGIYQAAEPGTIVVMEIDNVVIEPVQALGSTHWLEYETRQKVSYGLSWGQAYRSMLPTWNRILQKTKVRTSTPLIPGIVRWLQRQGILALGISSREVDVIAPTLAQLSSVAVQFFPAQVELEGLEGYGVAPTKYCGGVLFCGYQNVHGQALLDLIARAHFRPTKVIYISDNWIKVQEVQRAMTGANIPFLGVRYSGADQRALWYDPELAEVQLRFFDRVLTNEAAEELLGRRRWWWFF